VRCLAHSRHSRLAEHAAHAFRCGGGDWGYHCDCDHYRPEKIFHCVDASDLVERAVKSGQCHIKAALHRREPLPTIFRLNPMPGSIKARGSADCRLLEWKMHWARIYSKKIAPRRE
jgi:hypothetical protein